MTSKREPSKGPILSEVRLIAIPPLNTPEDDLVNLCLAAERGGASAIQVRLKDKPAAQLLRVTELLLSRLTVPVYVNDRADVARLAGAAGAHIGADDLHPATIRAVLPRPFRVGISVGSRREAAAAKAADVDYWSIGPFRATSTKADAGAALGAEGFRRLLALCPPTLPVIAVGGIGVDNIADAMRAGADGVAVVGAIFGQPDTEHATRSLLAALGAA